MRIAVISDIHSNYMALENALCLIDSLHTDGIVFLGDYLTDFPYPQRTLYLLDECRAALPCWFVRGNREDYLLRHRRDSNDGWTYSSSSGSLLYTYENITQNDLDVFERMPISLEISFNVGVPSLTACHASPHDSKEWIMNRPALIDQYSRQINGSALLCGHTHRGGVVESNGKRIIFCPSVGLPQDHRSGAKILLLEPKRGVWRYQTLTVGFDKERMKLEFVRSGLLEKAGVWARCIIRSMYEECDYASRCVALAWRIAAAEHFDGDTVLPEEYWERAARELKII
ncbi:MAG: metallophosphoesterase family protein [Clostridiales bacterium]|nr:metallophosphoesterase family protein [Clostridiales bacterium]